MKTLGLYIHIPFCRSKCAYCDFYSLPADRSLLDAYRARLCLELRKAGCEADGYTVDTVYFGGGTPSWFGAGRLARVLAAVRESFTLSPDCEITAEANPDSVTEEGLRLLRECGFNRLSLGVQSADDGELKLAGRPHTFAQAKEAVAAARRAGFENLSLDLIYGLPGQTMESWQHSVEEVLALEPQHISCYGLTVEDGTPFARLRDSGSLTFPDGDAQADEYLWLCGRLEQAGFRHYEISNFCLPGRYSRHNVKYWLLEEYLGFGPAAHSDYGGVRFGYTRDLNKYLRGCPEDAERTVMTPRDRLEEYVMLGLRLDSGISEQELTERGGTFSPALRDRLELFRSHGLLREEDGRWSCTPSGWLVSNRVIGDLLELL